MNFPCVVVVDDSDFQRIVLAIEETTVTQQVSHRPITCQYRLWSQRGTQVNGLHHGDNPLLRPTGIEIATKSYAALQAVAPTNNIKTVHQTSLLHIENNLDRLGMLSPTHDQRSQQKNGKITLQLVLINKSKFLKAIHCTEIRKKLPFIYINKDEPHLYTNISKVYLTSLLVCFNEDDMILNDLVYLEEEAGVGAGTPLERARRAVWGMFYADDAGVVSRSQEGLAKMMTTIVEVFGEFGLTVSEKKT